MKEGPKGRPSSPAHGAFESCPYGQREETRRVPDAKARRRRSVRRAWSLFAGAGGACHQSNQVSFETPLFPRFYAELETSSRALERPFGDDIFTHQAAETLRFFRKTAFWSVLERLWPNFHKG